MDKRLAKLAPNLMDIPRCFRVHGIAPALPVDIAGPYWDERICKSPANEFTSYGRWTEQQLIAKKKKALAKAFQTDDWKADIASSRPDPHPDRDLSVKSFVLSQRDSDTLPNLTPMTHVNGIPPPTPETCADGSVLYNPPIHFCRGAMVHTIHVGQQSFLLTPKPKAIASAKSSQ